MGPIEEHLQKAKSSLNADKASKALFDFVRQIEKELTQLNRDQLHENSKDIYGQAIGFYSKATEVITKGAKKAGEPFDAYDTGKLLGGLYAKVQNEMIVFGSTDPKVQLILNSDNWLSQDLFGLTDEALRSVINKRFRPFMVDYYRQQLLP